MSERANRQRAARENLKPRPVLATEFRTTILPPGKAQGAVDSTRGNLKAKHSGLKGLAGLPLTTERIGPKKRRRLSGNKRRARQRAENQRFQTTP